MISSWVTDSAPWRTDVPMVDTLRYTLTIVTSFVPAGLILANTVSLSVGAVQIARFDTLVQRGDLGLLRDIIGLLAAAVARGREVTTPVEVVSAVPLTAEERAALTQKLTDQYGSGLEFTYRVDPTILGGLILRVGDKLIDGSVAGKLAAMKQALGVTVVQGEG